jgi:hypothetical protein
MECKSMSILGHAYGGLHFISSSLLVFPFVLLSSIISLGGIFIIAFRVVSFIFKR